MNVKKHRGKVAAGGGILGALLLLGASRGCDLSFRGISVHIDKASARTNTFSVGTNRVTNTNTVTP